MSEPSNSRQNELIFFDILFIYDLTIYILFAFSAVASFNWFP